MTAQVLPNVVPQRLIGVGLYTVAEAARLTRVPPARIRRWIRGYRYKYAADREARYSPPVFPSEIVPIEGARSLSFLDLQEIRFVDAFRRRGVSWKTLRLAHERGQALVHNSHPFATGMFWTDGRAILLELAKGDVALLDIIRGQLAFKRIIEPYLSQLDFEHDQAIRWWPMGKHRRVVIDPKRNFGQPIVSKEGVPTAVLAKAYRVERSVVKVTRWFKVEEKSVRDAVAFERRLAA